MCLNFFTNLGWIGPSAMPIIVSKFHFKYSCLAWVKNIYTCKSISYHVLNIVYHSLECLQMVHWPLSILCCYLCDKHWNLQILALLISIVQHHCWHHLPQHSHNHNPLHLCPPCHDTTQLASSHHPDLVCNNCCLTLQEVSLFIELNKGALELGLEMEMGCYEYQECGRKGCSGFSEGRWRSRGLLWHWGSIMSWRFIPDAYRWGSGWWWMRDRSMSTSRHW